MVKNYSIAIDGPSASGKSTVAKIIAKRLGFVYIDTGAMYRAFTLAVIEHGLNPKSEIEASSLVNKIDIIISADDIIESKLESFVGNGIFLFLCE